MAGSATRSQRTPTRWGTTGLRDEVPDIPGLGVVK